VSATIGEIHAMEVALAAAKAEADRLDRVASQTDGLLSFMFPSDERRAANTALAVYEACVRVRNGIVDAPEPDHEEVARVVEMAHRVADPGWVGETIKVSTIGDAIDHGKIRDLLPKLPEFPSWLSTGVKLIPWVVGGVAIVAFFPLIREGSGAAADVVKATRKRKA
jgi:hypothetical protein